MLDKFRKGAAKAGVQATAFLKEGSSRVQSSSQSFAQGFSLPGEAEKSAKILATFLGLYIYLNTPSFLLNYFEKLILATRSLLSTQYPRSFYSVHEVNTLTICTFVYRLTHSRYRPSHLPGPQSWLRLLREGRLWSCHRTLTGRVMVRPILYCHWWRWLGPPNWRRHHRFRHCPQ
jgi:hypothetical protein